MQGQGYGFACDIWSLGVMFFELVCGSLPFGDGVDSQDGVIFSVLEDELKFPSKYNDNAGKNILKAMLTKDPGARIGSSMNGWEDIRGNKFFKAGVSGNLFNKLVAREMEPPVKPTKEQYSNEKTLKDSVSLSDAEELGPEGPDGSIRERIMEVFRRFDANGDGMIDKDELGVILQKLDPSTFTNESVDDLLSAADTNKDGIISFEEFLC